jgi:saccharopepsin
MKTTSVLAAAALVGAATAKVHKLKLDKVPLSEQFV